MVDAEGPFRDISDRPSPTGVRYRNARVYVWRDDRPCCVIDLPIAGGLAARDVARAVDDALRDRAHIAAADASRAVGAARRAGRIESRGSVGSATVVIATRNRPESLIRCIGSILACDGSRPEIVVVDSAPSDDATVRRLRSDVAHHDASIRYVRCNRPGLALAHDVALDHVRTDVVLFTDDDVLVDRRWVGALTSALAETSAACATGLILPAELETPTQCLIETAVGFDKGFHRRLFDLAGHRPADALFPFTAGTMGSGANMAFRTDYLRRAGGFDACLGAGSPGVGGDDLAAFMEVVVRGERLVYEPSAVVFHHHHADPGALRRQARAYGIGMTAAVSSVVAHHPRWSLGLARRVPRAIRFAVRSSSAKNARLPDDYPSSLRRRELLGLATGPWAYVWSRVAHLAATRAGLAHPPTTIARPREGPE